MEKLVSLGTTGMLIVPSDRQYPALAKLVAEGFPVVFLDRYFDSEHTCYVACENGADFTAVFASNDRTAFGAKKAIEDRGLRIPDDVSLMGYDDLVFSSIVGLATVTQPGNKKYMPHGETGSFGMPTRIT